MGKLLVILCIALFAVSLVMACKPPGVPCTDDSDCCPTLMCNPWAGRCTKKIGGPIWGSEPDDPAAAPVEEQQ